MQHTESQPLVTPAPVVVTEPASLKWGAIFGGTVAALGVGSMLYALGLAVGLSAIDPSNPASLRPSGIFTGIWTLIVSLIALFLGGFVAARAAGAVTRGFGALHGLVMWGLSVVLGAWLVGNVASAIVSGAADLGKTATRAVVGAAPAPGQLTEIAGRLGISSDDVLAPVNQRLRAGGRPEVTPGQLEASTRSVVNEAVRTGRLDREQLVSSISRNTALSRTDAEEIAQGMDARFHAAGAKIEQNLEQAKTGALKAAEESGKAFWGLFGALFLGMVAAIGGALLGGGRGGRSGERGARVVYRDSARTAPPREAYP